MTINKTDLARIFIALLIIAITIVLVINTLPGGSLSGEKTVSPNSSWSTSRPESAHDQKTVEPNSPWNTKQP